MASRPSVHRPEPCQELLLGSLLVNQYAQLLAKQHLSDGASFFFLLMKVQHRSSISVVKSDETAVCFTIKYVRRTCVVNLIYRTSDLVCGVGPMCVCNSS